MHQSIYSTKVVFLWENYTVDSNIGAWRNGDVKKIVFLYINEMLFKELIVMVLLLLRLERVPWIRIRSLTF